MPKTRIIFLAILSFFVFHFSLFITPALAGSVRIEPAVLDIQSEPHDYQYFTIHVINDTGGRIALYPMVGEFDATTGTVQTPNSPNQSASLISANLEINRELVEIAPHASASLTGKINVNPDIPEGTYHAIVGLVSEFPEAGRVGLQPDPAMPRVMLNITVRKEKNERLNLITFTALKKVFVRYPAKLQVRLENGGNVPITPDIETKFFGRGDIEKGSVKTDVPGGAVAAGKALDIPISWSGSGGYGRMRALISVSYGTANGGQLLTESATFWVFPLWLLVVAALILIILSYGAARAIVRSGHHHDA